MNPPHCIALEGELTIYAAEALRRQFLDALDAGDEVEVDLSAVNDLDTAGIQLLLAVQREAQRRTKAIRFVGHSPVVIDTLALCNLSSRLGLAAGKLREEQA